MPQPVTLNPHEHHGAAGARTVTVHVNEHAVRLPEHEATGLEIKTKAIEQGVSIQPDFILVEELQHGRTLTIGDHDRIHVNDHTRFSANDGDDNS